MARTGDEARKDGRKTVLGPEGTGQERRLKVLVWTAGLLLTLAILWGLHQTLWVSMPMTAAFFIAVGVWPVTDWVQRRLPKRLGWLGYVAAMTIILLVLALFFLGISYAATTVAEQWPQYDDRFQAWWDRLIQWFGSVANGAAGEAGTGATAEGGATSPPNVLGFVSSYALTIIQSAWEVVAVLVLIFFLVLLMLIEGRVWRAKLEDTARGEDADEWLRVVDDVGRRFRWYLVVRSFVGLISGALYALWLWLWGVDFVIVWFLLALLLNFVPTLGSLVAGGLAAAFAFLQLPPGTALIVAIGILAIEQVTGNYLDPRMQGRQLSVSPLVALFMLLLWGWVWGVAGALLAVPLTVLIMMVFSRFPALQPLALLLSGEDSCAALTGGGGDAPAGQKAPEARRS